VGDVRSNTQVDHGTTAVDGGGRAVGYLAFDEVLLVFVVLQNADVRTNVSCSLSRAYSKHLQERLLWDRDSLKLLLLLDGTFGELFESRVVGIGDRTSINGHLVEKSVIGGRSDAQVTPVVLLSRFTEDVGR
jgi:hypothetical protein